MNSHLIIDLMHQQLLPRILRQEYSLLPSADREVPYSRNYKPIFPYDIHSHSFFEWVWCVEDHACIELNDRVYRLEAGDFCLLPPGLMHAEVYNSSLKSYQVLWVSYQQETINANFRIYEPVDHLKCKASISTVAPPFTAALLGTLQHESKTQQTHREPFCRALVLALGLLMLRAFELSSQPAQHFPGKISVKVDNYLNEHFSESLSLADVSRELHFSRNHLGALYKKEAGKTMGQTLKEIRLEHAKRLLLETQLSVKETAKAVGYPSPEHFNRVFYKQEGITPGNYGR